MTKDERISIRLEAELKEWVIERGNGKFVYNLLVAAYEKLEKKKFHQDADYRKLV